MEFNFTNSSISIANVADLLAIEALLNAAYRGEQSTKGWTTEAHLISGNTRTTYEQLQNVLEQEGSVFLVYKKNNVTIGCVNLQLHITKLYLGMFAVEPTTQGGGVGKALLLAAEEWAIHSNAASIYMTVISLRTELVDWYKRNGYIDTSERKPFVEDGYSGKHLKQMEFMVLEKKIGC